MFQALAGLWLLSAQLSVDAGGSVPTLATSVAAARVASTDGAEREEALLDDGIYVRFGSSANGPVHVWRPASYKAETASIVIYIHGFYTDSDGAMFGHDLARQFRDSGRNALFIVPEARSVATDPVYWPSLSQLLATVRRRAGVAVPRGGVLVIAHSGGYKTAAAWLFNAHVDTVVLLDGLYGNELDFQSWVRTRAGRKTVGGRTRQLILVSYDTQERAQELVKDWPRVVRIERLPYMYDSLPPQARNAPVVWIQSERLGHMELVTSGQFLPWLLHALR